MPENEDIRSEYEARWNEFTSTFLDAAQDEGYFEDDILQSLEKICAVLEIYFGEDAAENSLRCLMEEAFDEGVELSSWRERYDDNWTGVYSETRVGNLFHDLAAYADFGIVLHSFSDHPSRRNHLESQVDTAAKLLSVLPIDLWGLKGVRFAEKLQKAIARWKVDSDQEVDIHELALLSGRALQTVKNSFSGSSFEHEREGVSRGFVKGEAAAGWLNGLKGFKNSIWHSQPSENEPEPIGIMFDDVVFVPVAPDGSQFSPEHSRDGVFTIGKQGKEQEFESYDEALSELQKMMTPAWRRPTPGGVWTRVVGVKWTRVPRWAQTFEH